MVSAAASGLSRSGSGKHDVEPDRDGAEPGQVDDDVRDPCPRPGKLAEFGQALFVDIDDGDRPCGLHAGVEALKSIEGSDPKFLDRSEIGDAQRRYSDQERQANQPSIPEFPREPPRNTLSRFMLFRYHAAAD